jgi:flagellin
VSTALGAAGVTNGVGTLANAQAAMTALDGVLDKIGTVRSAFGANINRLDHTINNLSNMKENTDTAKGRIMDADYAAESTNMTKNQMLMQAGM